MPKEKISKENLESIKLKENSEEGSELIDPNLKKKQNKQLFLIGIVMIIIIAVFLIVPVIIKNYNSNFNYNNLKFQKTKLKDITLYSTNIPIMDNYGKLKNLYSISFRNDPRVLKNIPVDKRVDESGGIKFIERNIVFISINPNMTACPDNSLALFNLGSFLTDSGLTVKSSFTDASYANKTNSLYITCDYSQDHTVIKITNGNETRIKQERTNCYEIVYKDCEITQATERFELRMIEDYMNQTTFS